MPAIGYALGSWGYYLSAIGLAFVLLWLFVRTVRDWQDGFNIADILLFIALGLTSGWAFLSAYYSGGNIALSLVETARNIGWLAFLSILTRQRQNPAIAGGISPNENSRNLSLIFWFMALLLIVQPVLEGLKWLQPPTTPWADFYGQLSMVARLGFAAGALVLTHNLYAMINDDSRANLRIPLVALAVMWLFDLNLYTMACLSGGMPYDLLAIRGIIISILTPLFLVAAINIRGWTVQLSRKMTFQSLSIFAIFAYFAVMAGTARIMAMFDMGAFGQLARIGVIFTMSIAAIALLPSQRVRNWLKVKIAKHFFKHRYDYRAEWLRFTSTLSSTSAVSNSNKHNMQNKSVAARIVKALCNITESSGGFMILLDEQMKGSIHGLVGAGIDRDDLPNDSNDFSAFTRHLPETPYIIELDDMRIGKSSAKQAATLPSWLLENEGFWLLIPLVQHDKVIAIVILQQLEAKRKLDWEDFDLMKIVSQQSASHLAEAIHSKALAEARQFEEFNRRFAFVMHDIKNLVSQLRLVAHNAPRHMDKPEFRDDMVETLQNSVGKMDRLLARLSGDNDILSNAQKTCTLLPHIRHIQQKHWPFSDIIISGAENISVTADPDNLTTILCHIVQNALEASPKNTPVTIAIDHDDKYGIITISDKGKGMTPEFIRERLFRPFDSSKTGGYGIGVYEARAMTEAMNGYVKVESAIEKGSMFAVYLPLAAINHGYGQKNNDKYPDSRGDSHANTLRNRASGQ